MAYDVAYKINDPFSKTIKAQLVDWMVVYQSALYDSIYKTNQIVSVKAKANDA
jgi:hypothetical protein